MIVTRSREGKKALSPAHFNQPAVTSCDTLLTVCLDIRRFCRWCEISGTTAGFHNFQAFVYSLIDATIFAQQICTIAEMAGLGTCYMGTTTYNAPLIAETLSLPDGVIPVASLTIGYPASDGNPARRLPLEAIMHEDRFHDYTDDDIRRYYAPTEAAPENAAFIAENGKENLAQVFAEVRYKASDNEYFSKVYLDYITTHGFPFPY